MTDQQQHERVEVFYAGRVQGVGFRYTAQRIASRLPVSGFVKNLPDGRVQLVAEAPPEALQSLLEGIEAALGRYIRQAPKNYTAATGHYHGFEIAF